MADIFASILKFVKPALWIGVPLFLFFVFFDAWLFYRRAKYKNSIVWKTLEIKIPKIVVKSPRAMEQVFAALHAIYPFGIRFWNKWWKGEVVNWVSFELAGRAHGVHFFVKTPEVYRNLVESAIYSQYSDAEIVEIQDYVSQFPPSLPNKNYDIWGADFILAKDDAYPILTYPSFEERGAIPEERRVDPIANITEVMSNLSESEAIWLQLLIRPAGIAWKEKAEALIDKLSGKKSTASSNPIGSFFHGIGEFLGNLIAAPVEYPSWLEAGAGKEKKEGGELTSGKKKIIEAIENKISKLGFEFVWRFVYIDKREAFTRSNTMAVMGAIRQFGTMHLNLFKPNLKSMTWARGIFKKFTFKRRQRFLYDNYRIRHFPKKFSVLNTEELATIYHFPLTGVKAPLLARIESKRGSPPPDLPVEI